MSARLILLRALEDPDNNRIVKDIAKYYENGKFDKAPNIELYNKFIRETYPEDEDSLINAGTKFAAMNLDQRVGFGLYAASKNEIRLS